MCVSVSGQVPRIGDVDVGQESKKIDREPDSRRGK